MRYTGLKKSLFCALGFLSCADAFGQSYTAHRNELQTNLQIQPLKDLTLTRILGLGPAEIHDPLPPEDTQHFFEHGYGDLRRALIKRGVTIDMEYWPQFFANLAGGLDQKQDYAHQISFLANTDLDRIFGWKHASLVFSGAERAGRRLSTDVFADDVYNPAQIYGGGGNVLFHLVYFYFQKSWDDERFRWIIGRYATGPDYDASMLLCTFGGGAVCSQPRLTTTINGYASWPSTAWGTNLKFRPTKDTYVVPGIFTSEAQHGGTAGTNWNSATGVSLYNEIGWEPELGRNRLSGHYKIGMMWDSSPHAYNRLVTDPAPPGSRKGQLMEWVAMDQMLWRHGTYATAGLIALAGYTHTTASIAPLSDQWYVGMVDFGMIRSRPYDGFGFLFTSMRYGANVQARYQPYYNVAPAMITMPGLGGGFQTPLVSSRQAVMEILYRVHISRGLYFSPEFQYFWRPGGTGRVKSAPILGFDLRVFF
ncbi:carbohydrate porin [Asaia prunellae]|uniref:carbohydrate porin n=1 Tax=Asaia prunellae TaxID=610245 RepID=UPI00131F2E9E|nr:carbohydrate porin [Asaia prunellae]